MIGYHAAMIFCTAAGTVFPAYKSFKALRTNDEEETQKWLKYWVVYALFVVAQFMADLILPWVPLYFEAKVAFILWLQLPQFNGASFVYLSFIEPFLKAKEEKIDFAIANSGRLAKEHSSKVISSITDKAGSLSSEVIKRTNKAKPSAESKAD